MVEEHLIITPADFRDAGIITEISITTFRETFAPVNSQDNMDAYINEEMNIEKLTAELNDINNLFYIARLEKEAVGYVKMRHFYNPTELSYHNPLEIERIYVRHQYLGRKYGASLMQHCIDFAIKNNFDVIWLGVWEHNHRAINFYKKWGFTLFGSHPFVLGNDVQRDVLMMKETA